MRTAHGEMARVDPRSIVRLGLTVLLVAPSDGFIARGVCVTRACRASCRAPPALAVAAPRHSHRSQARSAESTGDAGSGSSFGRKLGALALALMLIVSPGPGALPAFADPAVDDLVPAVVPACKEFASSCRAATGQPDPKAADKPERPPAAAASRAAPAKAASRRYINLTGFPFPLGPFTERRTVPTGVDKEGPYGLGASLAQAAEWPRLAEARGSLEHDLALREASRIARPVRVRWELGERPVGGP